MLNKYSQNQNKTYGFSMAYVQNYASLYASVTDANPSSTNKPIKYEQP